MNMAKTNWLNKGPAYTQAETALCIWEHVIEGPRGAAIGDDTTYQWFTQEQGIYHGRSSAIELAYLVDIAYETGQNGEEYQLDGWAFDWELVPVIINYFMGRADSPSEVTQSMAKECGIFLPGFMGDKE